MTKKAVNKLSVAIISNSNSDKICAPFSIEMVASLRAKGINVIVDENILINLEASSEEIKASGAQILNRKSAFSGAEVILMESSPTDSDLENINSNHIIVANFDARSSDQAIIDKLTEKKATLFALDLMPRITRAQSMDILSSQGNLAGYRAVIEASSFYKKALPMMMTAAGTIKPAKVFIMGVGVAGLQAIATAKRLGAIILATDVRPETKEQVESLGAKFIAVENEEFKEKAGRVYAGEMSKDYQAQQLELTKKTIADCDIVITTAQIPGRASPILVTNAMLATMKSGSIIYDLAAKGGGNCEASKIDKTVNLNGVTIHAPLDPLQGIAVTASQMLAGNYLNFLSLILRDSLKVVIDKKDEIIAGVLLSKDGKRTKTKTELTGKK